MLYLKIDNTKDGVPHKDSYIAIYYLMKQLEDKNQNKRFFSIMCRFGGIKVINPINFKILKSTKNKNSISLFYGI